MFSIYCKEMSLFLHCQVYDSADSLARGKLPMATICSYLLLCLKCCNMFCPNIQRDASVLLQLNIILPALLKPGKHVGSRKYMSVKQIEKDHSSSLEMGMKHGLFKAAITFQQLSFIKALHPRRRNSMGKNGFLIQHLEQCSVVVVLA